MLEWMGLNSYYYDGLQPKMNAGMIKLHECMPFVSIWQYKWNVRSSSSTDVAASTASSTGAASRPFVGVNATIHLSSNCTMSLKILFEPQWSILKHLIWKFTSIYFWNSVFSLYENKVLQMMSAGASLERFGERYLVFIDRANTDLKTNGL